MKNWRKFVLSLTLLIKGAFATPQVVDKIAVIVDNEVILESDVQNILNTMKHSLKEANNQNEEDTLRHQILDRLIMDKIILQLAQRANTTISDKQLDQTISNIAANSHMTLGQLRSNLAYDGVDYNTYRAQIRKKILLAEVSNSEMRRRINILPYEVEYLANKIAVQTSNSAKFNLSYILIPLPNNHIQDQLDQAEALANALVKQSKSSAEFGQLTIIYSNTSHALKSGHMSWNKLEELPSPVSVRLQKAHKGSIIGPIRSGLGFYIIKVNDIRGITQKVTVTEVHARHILLHTSEVVTDQQASAKLDDIAQQIKSSRLTFSNTAKQLSEDPDSANKGGDLGWRSFDTFAPELRNALLHLKKGEISSSIRSYYGWHLIQLLDTRQVDRTDAAQQDRAYRLLFNRKFDDEMQKWTQEHRTATYVKIINNHAQ
ncbi:peptidylprolyl isomerase SurA [Candidatus Hoaglandella endobia]|nr:peptidylprolyl isomerase SurA [Candidatus Hoaglandella endobia]